MTAVAISANLNDIQETNIVVSSINKDDIIKENFDQLDDDMVYIIDDEVLDNSPMKRYWFNALIIASLIVVGISSLGMFCAFLFTSIQLRQWKRLFENEWNSDIEIQYHQMQKYASAYFWIFVITTCSIPIYVLRIRGWIKILQKIHPVTQIIILFCLVFIIYVLLIFVIFVSVFTQTDIFLKHFPDNKYTLSTTPSSLIYLKFLCIISCVQHIILLVIMLLTKPKNFEIILDDDQCLPKFVTKQEQMISQDEEIDPNYVIC